MAKFLDGIRSFSKSLYRWLKGVNPFALMLVVFLVYWAVPPFSRQYSLWNQLKTQYQLRRVRSEHKKLQDEIEVSRQSLKELQLHQDMLEKYAREKYLMKAEDEDLFLLKK